MKLVTAATAGENESILVRSDNRLSAGMREPPLTYAAEKNRYLLQPVPPTQASHHVILGSGTRVLLSADEPGKTEAQGTETSPS